MGTLTVRNLDDETKQALRLRAARKGASLEEEVRTILREAAAEGQSPKRRYDNLYDAIRELVEPYGGFDLTIPERAPSRQPPTFD